MATHREGNQAVCHAQPDGAHSDNVAAVISPDEKSDQSEIPAPSAQKMVSKNTSCKRVTCPHCSGKLVAYQGTVLFYAKNIVLVILDLKICDFYKFPRVRPGP